ncbi:argininosuccinate lyase [Adlercreutzia sp. ZJ138]|uniref:FitA-like ribbon-helix-helix domain-containing protein n=1 Tax=Adlercreutzia sp. ZJ138 TaxID=2709405 RepID=UPI00197E5E04|nr:argininosuccinate lyase [Adlercreutzia sp. ZJ138]
MPALQVREFPEDLYEELRVFAARNHRSIAQQTVASVEQAIRGCHQAQCASERRGSFTVEPLVEREARNAKREEVFRRARERQSKLCGALPEPSTMLAEARTERDALFGELAADVAGEKR